MPVCAGSAPGMPTGMKALPLVTAAVEVLHTILDDAHPLLAVVDLPAEVARRAVAPAAAGAPRTDPGHRRLRARETTASS